MYPTKLKGVAFLKEKKINQHTITATVGLSLQGGRAKMAIAPFQKTSTIALARKLQMPISLYTLA